MKQEAKDKEDALKTAKRVSELQDLNSSQEMVISELQQHIQKNERAYTHLQSEVEDAKSRAKLAEKQYDGLKLTIRALQDENDEIKKENRTLEGRLVGDKDKLVHEMNSLTEMVESLRRENDMLRTKEINKSTEPKRNVGWFGTSLNGNSGKEKKDAPKSTVGDKTPKFGSFGVVMPSTPRHTVAAHNMEGMCLRYDGSGNNVIATASSDSTVKVWETGTGTVRATLHGSAGHAMIACDIYGSVVIGAGSDKTCRVWNHRTERMVGTGNVLCGSLLWRAATLTLSFFLFFSPWRQYCA